MDEREKGAGAVGMCSDWQGERGRLISQLQRARSGLEDGRRTRRQGTGEE